MDVNYNDGKWHGWNGSGCPVHPKSLVRAVFSDRASRSGGDLTGQWIECEAGQFQPLAWEDLIEAFRVVKPYREPRDLWHLLDSHGQVMDTFTDEGKARAATRLLGCTSIVHYREVMEGEA